MSASNRLNVGDEHRVEASHDNRTGIIHVRVRRHKRGPTVTFTLMQFREFVRMAKGGELDGLLDAALARAREGEQADARYGVVQCPDEAAGDE